MTLYKATIEYYVKNSSGKRIGSFTDEFFSSAKNPQYVKEKYHRYTHENYEDVDRALENDHTHQIGTGEITHQLLDIKEVAYSSVSKPLNRL